MEVKNITKYGLGTFTYREKPRVGITIVGSLTGTFLLFFMAYKLVSPVMPVANAYAPTAELNKPVITLPADPQSVQIENYIKEVFGKYSDKAIQLLTDPRCHENGKLNPQAVNHNWSKDGSYWSTDWGLFQLNDHFQGFNQYAKRFVFDYKINTMMAYKIFVDNGYRFDRGSVWTCGKELGI